jgi:3-phenylpropionate/cinnamic acid dioxygenase small subunit
MTQAEFSLEQRASLTFECSEFLFREAELLDGRQFQAWFELLSQDIDYRVPVRVTRERGKPEFANDYHYYDNWLTLKSRVQRLDVDRAYSENPATRTLRVVSNVRVSAMHGDEVVDLVSKLLVYRGFWESFQHDLISAERHDSLRRTDSGWSLCKRLVLLTQTSLDTRNLAILL